MDQMIYKLDQINEIDVSPGIFRKAASEEHEIISNYLHNFSEVIGEQSSLIEAKKKASEMIQKGTLHVWDHNGIVSMANKARASKNGIVVNAVYTPPEHRQKGYATACVCALSKMLLKDYKFCCLYTDLSNPTSNNIYQKIGYYPVAESAMIKISYNS